MQDDQAAGVGEVLNRIAAEYGFRGGLARNNPSIAVRQLQDAMRTCYKHKTDARFDRPENLPSQESLIVHLAALERLLQHGEDACSDAEIETLNRLPTLLCRDTYQAPREEYGSGLEYLAKVPCVGTVPYGSLADLIRQAHTRRFGTPE